MTRNIDGILTKAAYLYLTLPFLIFCLSWLNLPSSIAFSAITLISIYLCLKNVSGDLSINEALFQNRKSIYWSLFAILIIVFSPELTPIHSKTPTTSIVVPYSETW